MKVTAFLHLNRLTGTHVTGVGRHALEILRRLPAHVDAPVQWSAARDDFDACASALPAELQSLPHRRLPWSRKPLEICWKAFERPRIDRWLEAPDWIYCPAESLVPSRVSRVAVTVHDMHPLERGLPWGRDWPHLRTTVAWRFFIPRMMHHSDLILSVSEFTRDRITAMFPSVGGKIRVIGNGVNLSEFKPADSPTEAVDPPFILVVGGLREQKGGVQVLDTAEHLLRLQSRVQFKVTGRSLPHLEARARQLPNVELAGYVAAEDMPILYRRAFALYFPSRYEGFGLPVVEALASGTPVVCSDHPALLEAARGAALSCAATDVAQSVQWLNRLAEDSAFRSDCRQRALAVRPQLDWDPVVRRLVDALATAPPS